MLFKNGETATNLKFTHCQLIIDDLLKANRQNMVCVCVCLVNFAQTPFNSGVSGLEIQRGYLNPESLMCVPSKFKSFPPISKRAKKSQETKENL